MSFIYPRFAGFTLLEAIIVLAIIGTILSIVSISGRSLKQKSIDEERVADAQKIVLALEQYRKRCRTYPSSLLMATNNGAFGGSCEGGAVYIGMFLGNLKKSTNDTTWYRYQALKPAKLPLNGTLENVCEGYQLGILVNPGGGIEQRSAAKYNFNKDRWQGCGGSTVELLEPATAHVYHVWGPQ